MHTLLISQDENDCLIEENKELYLQNGRLHATAAQADTVAAAIHGTEQTAAKAAEAAAVIATAAQADAVAAAVGKAVEASKEEAKKAASAKAAITGDELGNIKVWIVARLPCRHCSCIAQCTCSSASCHPAACA